MASVEKPNASEKDVKSTKLRHEWIFIGRNRGYLNEVKYTFKCAHCSEEKHYSGVPEANITKQLLEKLNGNFEENKSYKDLLTERLTKKREVEKTANLRR